MAFIFGFISGGLFGMFIMAFLIGGNKDEE